MDLLHIQVLDLLLRVLLRIMLLQLNKRPKVQLDKQMPEKNSTRKVQPAAESWISHLLDPLASQKPGSWACWPVGVRQAKEDAMAEADEVDQKPPRGPAPKPYNSGCGGAKNRQNE